MERSELLSDHHVKHMADSNNGVIPGSPPGGDGAIDNKGSQTPPSPTPPTGAQTPSENLYNALKEEREKRKDLETRLQNLESLLPPIGGDDDDEDADVVALRKEVGDLREQITSMSKQSALSALLAKYPILKDKTDEFEKFRGEYPANSSLERVAQLFLAENGLIASQTPPPVGLERPSGGVKNAPTGAPSTEDVARLRETNPRAYIEMVRTGRIKPSEIK